MDRKETTKLLTEIVINNDDALYAKEVTFDYGTKHQKRIDVVKFYPNGVVHLSDIEKGHFICYEIKSCKADLHSTKGLNFLGEMNYIVLTMETYKEVSFELCGLEFKSYLRKNFPESSTHFGIMVAVPSSIDLRSTDMLHAEVEHPTEFGGKASDWKLWKALPSYDEGRKRSMTEFLFCMLRSKHTNMGG